MLDPLCRYLASWAIWTFILMHFINVNYELKIFHKCRDQQLKFWLIFSTKPLVINFLVPLVVQHQQICLVQGLNRGLTTAKSDSTTKPW